MKNKIKLAIASAAIAGGVVAVDAIGTVEAVPYNCVVETNSPANTGARANCYTPGRIHRVWVRCGVGTKIGPVKYGAWQWNGTWSYVNCSSSAGETVRSRGVEEAA